MFARNLLQAGEFVTCVPPGILVTLQYDEKGLLQKIFEGHEKGSWKDVSSEMCPSVIQSRSVPVKLTIKKGTTWVRGVFYSKDRYDATGKLPECISDAAHSEYLVHPEKFKFYAGSVESLATVFRGAVSTRQWLASAGFEILPGYVVPSDITEESFGSMVWTRYPFGYPFISSYIVFHKDGSISYPNVGLRQFVIDSVDEHVDSMGNIYAAIRDTMSEDIKYVPYSVAVQVNAQPGHVAIQNSDGDLLSSFTLGSKKDDPVRSNFTYCKCCGRKITIPASGNVWCPDSHCNSMLYPNVVQMLSTFNLPVISYERYKELSDSIGSVFTVVDILDAEEYSDTILQVKLSDVVRAVVPKSVVAVDYVINGFVGSCNDSPEVVLYYIQHPDKIVTDLDLDPNIYRPFINWAKDIENQQDVEALLNSQHINIESQTKRFDGAPIFRGKTIMITGSFSHGSYSDVEAILSSYSANVVRKFNDVVQCVLVGDLNENTNGAAIREARKRNIPVMLESQFFSQYDIDKDLAENL